MPEIDWVEAQTAVDAWDQLDGSRRSDQVEFVISIADDPDGDAAQRTAHEAGDSLADIVSPDELRWHKTGIGRGAEGDAVGIILTASSIVGGIVGVLELAERIGRAWRRLRRRKPSPTISLGAAKYLCIADLATRIGPEELGELRVVAAGDIGPNRSSEVGHTGADLFTVVLADARRTYVYVIDAEGGLVHFGLGEALSPSVALYGGIPVEAWEHRPRWLLPDDADEDDYSP